MHAEYSGRPSILTECHNLGARLGFRLILCTRRPASFAAALEERLAGATAHLFWRPGAWAAASRAIGTRKGEQET